MDCGNIKKNVASPFCIGQQLCNIIVIMIRFMIWDEAGMSYTYCIYLCTVDIIYITFAYRIHPCYSSCAGYSLVNEGGTAHFFLVDSKWWSMVPFAIWLLMFNVYIQCNVHMLSHLHAHTSAVHTCFQPDSAMYGTLSLDYSFPLVSGTVVTAATKKMNQWNAFWILAKGLGFLLDPSHFANKIVCLLTSVILRFYLRHPISMCRRHCVFSLCQAMPMPPKAGGDIPTIKHVWNLICHIESAASCSRSHMVPMNYYIDI